MISERSNLDFYSKGLLKSLEDDVVNENGNKPASNCGVERPKRRRRAKMFDDETSCFFVWEINSALTAPTGTIDWNADVDFPEPFFLTF